MARRAGWGTGAQRDGRDPRHGSRVKSLPGLEIDGKRIVTSDEVLRLDTLPKDIVIVGAGAVGVEFASMFHDVGVKVTLLEYLPNIVPLEDPEVGRVVERASPSAGSPS